MEIIKRRNWYWQDVRALCIFLVVLIHLPLGSRNDESLYLWLFIRQFINFPVAIFIFLAGYFCNFFRFKSIYDFYIIRLKRVLVPYFIFSIFYIFALPAITKREIDPQWLLKIITGCGPLYFLVVLTQLTLITPLLIKYLRTFTLWIFILFSFIIYIVFYYLYGLSHNTEFLACQTYLLPWLPFYAMGLFMRNVPGENISKCLSKFSFVSQYGLYLILVILSMIEGFTIYFCSDNYAFAISQIKLSSLILSLYFILILFSHECINTKRSFVTIFGDYSMGIFLLHPFFYYCTKFILNKTFPVLSSDVYPMISICNLISWTSAIILSVLFCSLIDRILPQLAKTIGLK